MFRNLSKLTTTSKVAMKGICYTCPPQFCIICVIQLIPQVGAKKKCLHKEMLSERKGKPCGSTMVPSNLGCTHAFIPLISFGIQGSQSGHENNPKVEKWSIEINEKVEKWCLRLICGGVANF